MLYLSPITPLLHAHSNFAIGGGLVTVTTSTTYLVITLSFYQSLFQLFHLLSKVSAPFSGVSQQLG